MSDGPNSGDSTARKWLKAITWAYVIGMLICELTGLDERIVPARYATLLPHGGFALVMLAYRRPGLKGWILVLLGWTVVGAAMYEQLTRP